MAQGLGSRPAESGAGAEAELKLILMALVPYMYMTKKGKAGQEWRLRWNRYWVTLRKKGNKNCETWKKKNITWQWMALQFPYLIGLRAYDSVIISTNNSEWFGRLEQRKTNHHKFCPHRQTGARFLTWTSVHVVSNDPFWMTWLNNLRFNGFL
jgi:hypothetical protein